MVHGLNKFAYFIVGTLSLAWNQIPDDLTKWNKRFEPVFEQL